MLKVKRSEKNTEIEEDLIKFQTEEINELKQEGEAKSPLK